jgi:Tol biopolymer transport system component
MAADRPGASARQISGPDVSTATWSPEGSMIAFTQLDDGAEGYGLFVARADGTAVRRVADAPLDRLGSYPSAMTWSPDGKTIAYVHGIPDAIGFPCRIDLWGLNVGTGKQRQLTVGECDLSPTWSPDATTIAFHRNEALWTIRADGSKARQLSPAREPVRDGPGFSRTAAWSPDGTQIAYDFGSDVFVIDAEGSDAHALTRRKVAETHEAPSWSHDGTRLALREHYGSDHPEDDSSYNRLIIVDRSGTVLTRLATDRIRELSTSWSADDLHLLVERYSSGGPEHMQVAPIDGSPPMSLGTYGLDPLFAP